MTAAPEASLTPVSPVQTVLAKKGVTVADVLRAVMQPAPSSAPDVKTAAVPLPKKVTTGDEVRVALATLPSLLSTVRVVNTPRALTPAEQDGHGKLLAAVKTVKSWIGDIESDLAKPTWFNHFDSLAERAGDGDAPRESHGWLLRKGQAVIEGLGVKPTREVRSAQVEITAEGLLDAVTAGRISRRDYLEMTEQVRVTNELAVLGWVSKHPEKAAVIAEYATVKQAASVSLTLR